MFGTKGFFQSKTIWAAAIGLLAVALQHFGYTLDDADKAALIGNVSTLVQVVSGIAAMFFRVQATRQVAPPFVKEPTP